MTLRMFSGLNRENIALARRLGLRITTESVGPGADIEALSKEKLLGADITYNHCNGWSDAAWQRGASRAARST